MSDAHDDHAPDGWIRQDADRTRLAIRLPRDDDDKYTRGVLGVRTGSDRYPGAAVLGVEAAARTGVGMIRYLGPAGASASVLARRPEVVTADGRVQAWLVGSGMDRAHRDAAATEAIAQALGQGLPSVVDAGALDLVDRATGPVVVTPHFRELSRLLDGAGIAASVEEVAADAAGWVRAARATAAEQRHLLPGLAGLVGSTSPLPGIPVRVISGTTAGPLTRGQRRDLVRAHRSSAAAFEQGAWIPAPRSEHMVPITDPDVVAAAITGLL
ncbi:ADP-dependent NAD(P)H-hydrate dehydratase [Clavibacter michiganensis]|uniref:ADP-dependent NAD(P)H-hydrate dehydratase n=1 Tax=Clavibacter michiganensis TaxID=28447 RepID=UPI003743BD00